MIWLYRLSKEGLGVKNVELATALDFSKPSVHNMLKSLTELGVVTQESFGLAHLTRDGSVMSGKYERCFVLLQEKMKEICGENGATENAICTILADMAPEKLDELCKLQKLK